MENENNSSQSKRNCKNYNADQIASQIAIVDKEIETAMNKGRFECTISDEFRDEVLREISEAGFFVERIKTGINEYGIEIKW